MGLGPEGQHHFVGRLQTLHESIEKAISKTPHESLHVLDLLVVARDATHKAMMAAWNVAPSFPDQSQS